jgi:hypothetical protein
MERLNVAHLGARPPPAAALEPQFRILVPAPRTFHHFRSRRRGVERVAPDAVKNGFATLPLETPVITTVVVEPQAEEDDGDESAIDEDGGRKIEHARSR